MSPTPLAGAVSTQVRRRKALLIGITYASTPASRLNGCINDAIYMQHLLTTKVTTHCIYTNNEDVWKCIGMWCLCLINVGKLHVCFSMLILLHHIYIWLLTMQLFENLYYIYYHSLDLIREWYSCLLMLIISRQVVLKRRSQQGEEFVEYGNQ